MIFLSNLHFGFDQKLSKSALADHDRLWNERASYVCVIRPYRRGELQEESTVAVQWLVRLTWIELYCPCVVHFREAFAAFNLLYSKRVVGLFIILWVPHWIALGMPQVCSVRVQRTISYGIKLRFSFVYRWYSGGMVNMMRWFMAVRTYTIHRGCNTCTSKGSTWASLSINWDLGLRLCTIT